MSVVSGVCKKQTNVKGVGGVKSINKNMPTPKEYGRQHLSPANIGTVS